jgi:predicted enzyme related to lactoylglutathione lyase
MSGQVVHFEISFDDAERAHAFYEKVFGWDLNHIPEMDYTMVSTGPSGEQGPTEPGFINGGMFQKEDASTPGTTVVIDVDDIDAALAKVEELGGQSVVGRTPVGDMGWSAYFLDTEGNRIGLWESAQQA